MLWVGWGFIVLGIIGTFLPILQGFLFFAIGLVILSRRSPRVRLLVIRLGRRYPKLRHGIEVARVKLRQYKHAFLRRLPWRRHAHHG